MAKKKKEEFDIWDANARASIAFSLSVISLILLYLVFFYFKLIPGQ